MLIVLMPSVTMRIVWRQRELGAPRWGCPHDGPGRQALQGTVVESYRDGTGVPRQRRIASLPSVRSCCLRDPHVRIAFWEAVQRFLISVELSGPGINYGRGIALEEEIAKRVRKANEEEKRQVQADRLRGHSQQFGL